MQFTDSVQQVYLNTNALFPKIYAFEKATDEFLSYYMLSADLAFFDKKPYIKLAEGFFIPRYHFQKKISVRLLKSGFHFASSYCKAP